MTWPDDVICAPGLVIAAPASGVGKTVVTLGLLRAFRDRKRVVRSAKAGPDYIDSRYHAAASGAPCVTLDSWSMRPELLDHLVSGAVRNADLLIIEGVMGLFDGAVGTGSVSDGSTAGLGSRYGLPVVLVVDTRGQAQSVAALVGGFRDHRQDLAIAGVILNRVAGPRHETLLRNALDAIGMPVFGALPASDDLALPSRHLGLRQACEHPALEAFLAGAAAVVGGAVDLAALSAAATPVRCGPTGAMPALTPPGQRVAVARDESFGFAYDHVLEGWRASGAEISVFSPLLDESPDADADAVYLPGGYPELHAGRIAASHRFRSGLRWHAGRGHTIYGECGGYMVLGSALIDADGAAHRMAGLLNLETSLAPPRLSLGYRHATARSSTPLARKGSMFRGHEFHHATVLREDGEALFDLTDAAGHGPRRAGLRQGSVFGSFFHLVDSAGTS